MKYIDIKDLIKGEIYTIDTYNKFTITFDKLGTNNIIGKNFMYDSGFSKDIGGWGLAESKYEGIRLATYQEIQQLKACIKANKYVEPIKEINYEIY